MSHLCSILSKREDLVDFRPAVHNRLYLADDTFDMRLGAFLSLKSVLEKKKVECFGGLVKSVVAYLCSERHNESVFSSIRKVRCTVLSFGKYFQRGCIILMYFRSQCCRQGLPVGERY